MKTMRAGCLGLFFAVLMAIPAQGQLAPVILQPGDAVEVSLWPDTEGYSGVYRLNDEGLIFLPLVGEVLAAGLPMDELRSVILSGYTRTMANRQVSLVPRYNVGILGAVRNPSIYTVSSTDNVFDVIALAGGFAGADEEKVRIVREGQIIHIDALRSLEEGINLDTYRLRSGDQIVVERQSGITLRTVFEVVRTVSTLAILIDRFSN